MIIQKEMKMKSYFFRLLAMITVCTLWVGFYGCTSSPSSRFYALTSTTAPGPETKPSADDGCLSLGLGPIYLPEYLVLPQIVTRKAPNEIMLAEFDRWAEPLKDNFARVLAKNLSNQVCTKVILLFPWRGGIPVDYRVEMNVLRLDGSLGENVFLEVWWMVFSGDRTRMVLAKRSTFTEAVGGQDYKSFVSAESRLLGHFSDEIAVTIKALPK